MPNSLSSDDADLLLKACEQVRINPATIENACNPWSENAKGANASEVLKAAVFELNPQRASEWMSDAGIGLSLAAEAVLAGKRECDQQVWDELSLKMPHVVKQQRELAHQNALKKLEEDAEAAKTHAATQRKYAQARWASEKQENQRWAQQWMQANRGAMNRPAHLWSRPR